MPLVYNLDLCYIDLLYYPDVILLLFAKCQMSSGPHGPSFYWTIMLLVHGTQRFVYREGDIVKQPMKKGSFVPKNVPGVGWGGVGWVGHEGVGWGGS